jgi:SSS family solute:Na+ symporter
VALTDIIQVVILIFGGLAITWIALDAVGAGNGAGAGLSRLGEEVPGHFEMILDESHPNYSDLPGIWTLLGGLWVLHFSYWGFNQYIIQRALGAESLAEAQKGLAFAAFLKLLIPLIVVIPGIAALVLAQVRSNLWGADEARA